MANFHGMGQNNDMLLSRVMILPRDRIVLQSMASTAALFRVRGREVPFANMSANDSSRPLYSLSRAPVVDEDMLYDLEHTFETLRDVFEDPQSLLEWKEAVVGPFDVGRHRPWMQFVDLLDEDGADGPGRWEVSELTGAE